MVCQIECDCLFLNWQKRNFSHFAFATLTWIVGISNICSICIVQFIRYIHTVIINCMVYLLLVTYWHWSWWYHFFCHSKLECFNIHPSYAIFTILQLHYIFFYLCHFFVTIRGFAFLFSAVYCISTHLRTLPLFTQLLHTVPWYYIVSSPSIVNLYNIPQPSHTQTTIPYKSLRWNRAAFSFLCNGRRCANKKRKLAPMHLRVYWDDRLC